MNNNKNENPAKLDFSHVLKLYDYRPGQRTTDTYYGIEEVSAFSAELLASIKLFLTDLYYSERCCPEELDDFNPITEINIPDGIIDDEPALAEVYTRITTNAAGKRIFEIMSINLYDVDTEDGDNNEKRCTS